MLGVGAVLPFSSVSGGEQPLEEAAQREAADTASPQTMSKPHGRAPGVGESAPRAASWTGCFVAAATAIFIFFATMARSPRKCPSIGGQPRF